MFRLPENAQKVMDIYNNFDWQQVVQMPVTKFDKKSSKIEIHGEDCISFGSGSYLGLHKDERIIEGGIKVVRDNGVIYASSRSFTYLDIISEYDLLLSELFGAPTIATINTVMADLNAILSLVLPEDVLLIDHQAHATLQNLILIPKALGTTIDRVKHSDLNHLETKIKHYSTKTSGKIWYICDGVYSMYGDLAPVQEIMSLLDKYDNLYLYIDDAHGMSWTGPNGGGYVKKYIPVAHPKVIMVTSLGKGYGVGGGALICPNDDISSKLKKVGMSNVFCTQLSNFIIGSGIAAAKIHLSDEIYILQDKIKSNIEYFIEICRNENILIHNFDNSPIFYFVIGSNELAIELNMRLRRKGFYGNLGIYPAVSPKTSGIRISLTSDHTKFEMNELIIKIKETLFEILDEKNLNIENYFTNLSNENKLAFAS